MNVGSDNMLKLLLVLLLLVVLLSLPLDSAPANQPPDRKYYTPIIGIYSSKILHVGIFAKLRSFFMADML